ncbi:MAG: hypothetical protein FWE57_01210 [Chitinispirillia bacterium]|nr:hypothetical protein [Chitinispirillia bacterium]
MNQNIQISKKPAVSPISYLYFALFFISGVSGLIYESIWSQYLKQFLGHAAYAQTLVLVIYMGGMALGAWITSLFAVKIRNLLLGYAVVEIALGLFALYFHDAFVAYLDVSFGTVIPSLGNSSLINIYKWATASFIILPQSMLLGATFPLMAGGILRRFPGLSGYKTSFIYFVNTFGAAIGVLVSGFYLAVKWGLEGAIIAAGMIDLFVGIAILCLWMYDKRSLRSGQSGAIARTEAQEANIENPIPVPDLADRREYYYPLLAIAGLTAAAHFIYEIAWIRMLSLVLGSSTHSFELMLSAFILGLALGAFFIRNKLDDIKNTPRFLGIIQLIMGITAISTIFTYGNMFKLMSFTMNSLGRSEGGYILFNIVSHVICMIIMLPTTICAGMVIPLVIHMLYKRGYGEQTIGKVYAVNTAGGIIGVVLSVWVLMETVGLKYLIIIGAALDMAVGVYAFYHFRETRKVLSRVVAVPVCLVVLVAAVMFANIDPALISSGVFRHGGISTERKRIIDHIDGKTASITLFESGKSITITTNGKPDASVGIGELFTSDEYTMALTGILPLAVRENIRTAAVIGMGSGMTSHYMLYDPQIELLDVIEIERAMVTLAEKIGPKVANNFTDPRCNIYIEDAKTFFAAQNRTYDVIISEPSNPWVSGVANLFSREFFSHIRRHINDGGVLVQWIQAYETDITVFASILKALGEYFPIYDIYMQSSDLLIIAAKDPGTDISIKRDIFQIEPMAKSLGAKGFAGLKDLKHLRVTDKKFFDSFINSYKVRPNSDFHSYVDHHAAKYRFKGSRIGELDQLKSFVIPVQRIISADTVYINLVHERRPANSADTGSQSLAFGKRLPNILNLAPILRAKITAHELSQSADTDTVDLASLLTIRYASARPGEVTFSQIENSILQILQSTLPYLSAKEMREIWDIIEKKVSNRQFTEEQAKWMAYYKSLCYYDIPEMRRLSFDLLPKDTTAIRHSYGNQMLLASMLASSVAMRDTTGIGQVWDRYTEKGRPSTPLRAVKSIIQDPLHKF